MHRGHSHAVVEEGKVLEGDGFVGVISDNVFHHEMWREGLGWGEIARKVKSRGAVVGSVSNVKGVRSRRSKTWIESV